jgi:hypothetical protein
MVAAKIDEIFSGLRWCRLIKNYREVFTTEALHSLTLVRKPQAGSQKKPVARMV